MCRYTFARREGWAGQGHRQRKASNETLNLILLYLSTIGPFTHYHYIYKAILGGGGGGGGGGEGLPNF